MNNFIAFIQDKKRILKRRKKPGNYPESEEKDDPLWERKSAKLSQQATEIKENVTRLRELLQESRAGYLGLANAEMSDRQRNEIDNGQRKSCLLRTYIIRLSCTYRCYEIHPDLPPADRPVPEGLQVDPRRLQREPRAPRRRRQGDPGEVPQGGLPDVRAAEGHPRRARPRDREGLQTGGHGQIQ